MTILSTMATLLVQQAYVYALHRGAEHQATPPGCIKNFDGKPSLEKLDTKEQGKIT